MGGTHEAKAKENLAICSSKVTGTQGGNQDIFVHF
jgi:hypothetical protein